MTEKLGKENMPCFLSFWLVQNLSLFRLMNQPVLEEGFPTIALLCETGQAGITPTVNSCCLTKNSKYDKLYNLLYHKVLKHKL
jgi:hypothetical protein